MDKSEILFIRACKSKNKQLRLRSVFKRTYIANDIDEFYYAHLADILSKIYTKCKKQKDLIHILIDTHPNNVWAFGGDKEDGYYENICYVLTSYISLMKKDDLPEGFYPSLYWRKRLNEVSA